MTATVQFWDRIARRYAAQPISDLSTYETTMERTRSYLGAEDSVLELGCGTGSTALLLASDAGAITASDVSPEMTQIGKEKAAAQGVENVTFVTASAGCSPVDAGSQDAVLAFNLLHLLEDLDQALAQARTSLKPGGYFISKTACLGEKGWYLRPVIGAVRLFMAIRHRTAPPLVRYLRIAELERRIAGAGFDLVETANHGKSTPGRFIVARRR